MGETFKASSGRAWNNLLLLEGVPAHRDPFQPQPSRGSVKTHERHQGPADTECLFPAASRLKTPPKTPGPAEARLGPPYLGPWWRRRRGHGQGLVSPGQGGTEPLDLAEVDEERALGAIHTKKRIAGVRGPAGPHPLQGAKKHMGLIEEMGQPCQRWKKPPFSILFLWLGGKNEGQRVEKRLQTQPQCFRG